MPAAKPIFTKETFDFFRDLGKHNKKEWMDANRERYREAIVQPFRRMLEEVAPAVLDLDDRFDVSGRTGANFSRINRDIRFAKDKTIYKTQMYMKFSVPAPEKRETGQLYLGLSTGDGYGRIPDLLRCEAQGIHAGTDCGTSRGGKSEMGGPAEEAAGEKVRQLLVFHDKGRMDQTRRLAHGDGKLEKAAGLDRAKEIETVSRD